MAAICLTTALCGLLSFMLVVAEGFQSPAIIARRGSPCHFPECTLEGYHQAIEDGADYMHIEVVSTKDGELVVLPDIVVDHTTDVATQPGFSSLKTTKMMPNGTNVTAWFASDFTAPELKSLYLDQRLSFRDHINNDKFRMPLLAEVLRIANQSFAGGGGSGVGVHVEPLQVEYHRNEGLPLDELLVDALVQSGLLEWGGRAVVLQSLDPKVLEQLGSKIVAAGYSLVPLIWKLDCDEPSYEQLVEFAKFGTGLAPKKMMVAPEEFTAECRRPPDLPVCREAAGQACSGRLRYRAETLRAMNDTFMTRAHAAKLRVFPYAFGNEERYMPIGFRGDPSFELDYYAGPEGLGADGVYTDCTSTAYGWRSRVMQSQAQRAEVSVDKRRSQTIGIVVGSVLGAVAALCLAGLWRRWRKRAKGYRAFSSKPQKPAVGDSCSDGDVLEHKPAPGRSALRDRELSGFSTFQMVALDPPTSSSNHGHPGAPVLWEEKGLHLT